jgi:hypothetical protein
MSVFLPLAASATSTSVPHIGQTNTAGGVIFFVVCGILAIGGGALLLARRARAGSESADTIAD